MEKQCLVCWKTFVKKINVSIKNWEISKYCSSVCCRKNTLPLWRWFRKMSPETREKVKHTFIQKWNIPWNKGTKWLMPEAWNKWKSHLKWENHPMWKGGVTLDPEKFKERLKYYRSQEKYKLNKRIYQAVRKARKISTSDGTVNAQAIRDIFEKQEWICHMCKKTLQEYHIDHIIPLSKKWPHSIWNIQLLCPFCNMSKHDKI